MNDFTLPEMRRACVVAFLRGQKAMGQTVPEMPLPEVVDGIINEILKQRT